MQTLLGGRRVSTFTQNNKLYDVIVQLDPAERATPNDVAGLYVSGRGGQLVQLSAVTNVKEGVGPQRLNHFDRVRSFTLTAGLNPGFTLGEALDSLNRVAAEVLPPLASTRLAGESRELAESGAALYFAFGLALLVVFMEDPLFGATYRDPGDVAPLIIPAPSRRFLVPESIFTVDTRLPDPVSTIIRMPQ